MTQAKRLLVRFDPDIAADVAAASAAVFVCDEKEDRSFEERKYLVRALTPVIATAIHAYTQAMNGEFDNPEEEAHAHDQAAPAGRGLHVHRPGDRGPAE